MTDAGGPSASHRDFLRDFLGTWTLIPESCKYEQGDAPVSGAYVISAVDDVVTFATSWTDPDGTTQKVSFSGPADGRHFPFAGGELADALSIEAVSARELNSYAYYEGKELMVAQRQLDASGQAMRITQVVRLLNGERPANVSVYRRS